jgi:hypothetical protein
MLARDVAEIKRALQFTLKGADLDEGFNKHCQHRYATKSASSSFSLHFTAGRFD